MPEALCFLVAVRPSEAWNNLFPPVHGSVGPSDRPLPFCGMSVRLSVRPERFPGICPRTNEGIVLKVCLPMYLGHFQNRLDYIHGLLSLLLSAPLWLMSIWSLLIFQILALFWLRETGQIWGFREFAGERMEETAWKFACWCILTTHRTS